MKCYGTLLFLKGLWMDLSGEVAEIHMRTDANNLVTTAKTTHLPEQKETIHMISQIRTEACSGDIEDLAHVPTGDMLADPMTKSTIKADALIKAVNTSYLPGVDKQLLFRDMMRGKHRAYLAAWITDTLKSSYCTEMFLGLPVHEPIEGYCAALSGWYGNEHGSNDVWDFFTDDVHDEYEEGREELEWVSPEDEEYTEDEGFFSKYRRQKKKKKPKRSKIQVTAASCRKKTRRRARNYTAELQEVLREQCLESREVVTSTQAYRDGSIWEYRRVPGTGPEGGQAVCIREACPRACECLDWIDQKWAGSHSWDKVVFYCRFQCARGKHYDEFHEGVPSMTPCLCEPHIIMFDAWYRQEMLQSFLRNLRLHSADYQNTQILSETEYEFLCDICNRNQIDVGACEPHDVAEAIRVFFARRNLPEPGIRCGDVTAIAWWPLPTDESDDEDSEDWDIDPCSSQCVSCYSYPCYYRQGHDRPLRCYCLRHSGEADDLFVSWQHRVNRTHHGPEAALHLCECECEGYYRKLGIRVSCRNRCCGTEDHFEFASRKYNQDEGFYNHRCSLHRFVRGIVDLDTPFVHPRWPPMERVRLTTQDGQSIECVRAPTSDVITVVRDGDELDQR